MIRTARPNGSAHRAEFCYELKNILGGLVEMPSVDVIARTLSSLQPDDFCGVLNDLSGVWLRKILNRRPGRPNSKEGPVAINIDGTLYAGPFFREIQRPKYI
jgi:hypothetical protein